MDANEAAEQVADAGEKFKGRTGLSIAFMAMLLMLNGRFLFPPNLL